MSEDIDTSGPLSRSRERARVRARSLRETPTDAESLLWYHLRDRRMADHKFRRQRPIGPYFADFACLEAKLIVELDGGQHLEAAAYDENRTRFMQAQGYRVLRFWNNEVLTQTDVVRERILQALQEDNPHPNPLPQAGEGARQDTRTEKP
ncbi:DNA methyltransferase [Variovorax sp. KBW07]|uniref:endonuclease domain-containing protein n=1 Tax=Variovorax sp. KBW07 TaxID=2153358 RepID=UPI000F5732D3|nr:endonuclease domain-containing protein [Variovorax sp. KBW07]RQO43113.1 DNA methyltransferase [Variovorax sp. KBW07]